ncbi:hypothetical protein BDP27DRAFT_1421912 [Rhodocollybia butyracea]|uniref:SET domain-containing protein n=1 Tax=Rhodocollybia butyracea TaxID=206335 RepID=A0A9P5PUS9_9AGAR|nr:hypothetical protein BDP27DRAFT_1421912 [Rhodocollybia butyracea]
MEGKLRSVGIHQASGWVEAVLDKLVFTNIPPGMPSDTADNTVLYVGEQIVLDKLRRKHGEIPQKYTPLSGDQVVIQPTSSMGLGVFAKRNFEPGDLVVCERPLLVIAADIYSDPSLAARGLNTNYLINLRQLGTILKSANSHFLRANRDAFADLSKDYALDPVADILIKDHFPELYILSCNGFKTRNDSQMFGVYKDYRVVPRVASRINHSCSPNAIYYFDEATFTFNVVATRKIEASSEISLMYCALEVPRVHRHDSLRCYNIDPCRCVACETSDKEGSDRRRKMIKDIQSDTALVERLADLSLAELLRIQQAVEEEGLHYLAVYPWCCN